MIDIHSHIIHGVDDGSKDLETSLQMIRESIEQGVDAIICTPHYRKNLFETSLEMIEEKYTEIKKSIAETDLNIKLYLGQEIYCRNFRSLIDRITEGKVRFLGNSAYLLLEFPLTEEMDISEFVYNCQIKKLNIIIAHVERYEYLTLEDVMEIRKMGALIQVNASSLIKPANKKNFKRVKKLLDNDLVDFISSDIHANRLNYMKKAFDFISKKYGVQKASKLFQENALKLI